jgi:hypothetical protein
MNNKHLITPPPELRGKWEEDWHHAKVKHIELEDHIAIEAARWGADQQLAEDAKWLDCNALNETHLRIIPVGEALKEAMRPKPPTLKEQALAALEADPKDGAMIMLDLEQFSTIRKALEALPND